LWVWRPWGLGRDTVKDFWHLYCCVATRILTLCYLIIRFSSLVLFPCIYFCCGCYWVSLYSFVGLSHKIEISLIFVVGIKLLCNLRSSVVSFLLERFFVLLCVKEKCY
jgi:hypothetical protein